MPGHKKSQEGKRELAFRLGSSKRALAFRLGSSKRELAD
jgi:hypothetical protein